MCEVAKDITFTRTIVEGILGSPLGLAMLYNDNESAIYLVKTDSSSKMRHLSNIKFHYIHS